MLENSAQTGITMFQTELRPSRTGIGLLQAGIIAEMTKKQRTYPHEIPPSQHVFLKSVFEDLPKV